MNDGEILPVRAVDCAPGARVPGPIGGQRRRDVARIPAFERDRRPGEIVVGSLGELGIQRRNSSGPPFGKRFAMLRHRLLERGKPGLIPLFLGKQLVPRPHRGVVARGMVGMTRLQREDEPVQEAPAVARGGGE